MPLHLKQVLSETAAAGPLRSPPFFSTINFNPLTLWWNIAQNDKLFPSVETKAYEVENCNPPPKMIWTDKLLWEGVLLHFGLTSP